MILYNSYMKRFFLLLILLNLSSAYAFEIVYPKSQNVSINSDKTFFIGNENNSLKINNQPVKLHFSGGFKHAVKLNYGNNKFLITNGVKTVEYNIFRPKPKKNPQITYNFFDEPIYLKVVSENSPLRSVPVDAGLNRLSHLQNDMLLKAVGEYGNFYKIQLARDDFAWIMKSYVKETDELPNLQKVNEILYETSDNSEKYTFYIGGMAPYVLYEADDGYDLTIYGLDENIYPFGKFEYHMRRDTKGFGYSVYYDENKNLIVEFNKPSKNFAKIVFTVDPGHGGSEFGAIGCLGDKEKDINLKISLKLKEKLEALGAKVFMTRADDSSISLADRVEIANKNNTNIFISLHNNALPDSQADKDVSGTDVYYFYYQAKPLAKAVSDGIALKTGLKNNGIKGQSFAVIRNSKAVSILIEAAYMITPEDNYKLQKDDFQDLIVDGIITGLENYLNE